jgi:hypothetical protein
MARRKNVKRIDPRYFLHETVDRGELEEGCPFEEPAEAGEAISISEPGMEVQVDDISQLSPEDAFGAGIAAAKQAIDDLIGGDEEEVEEIEEGAFGLGTKKKADPRLDLDPSGKARLDFEKLRGPERSMHGGPIRSRTGSSEALPAASSPAPESEEEPEFSGGRPTPRRARPKLPRVRGLGEVSKSDLKRIVSEMITRINNRK